MIICPRKKERLLIPFWLSLAASFLLCMKSNRKIPRNFYFTSSVIVFLSVMISLRFDSFHWKGHSLMDIYDRSIRLGVEGRGFLFCCIHLLIWNTVFESLISVTRSFSFGEAHVVSHLITFLADFVVEKSVSRIVKTPF